MGLGKTIQTLSFIQYLHDQNIDGPTLIVVPTSVLPNWEREASKFVPSLKLLTIYGTRRENMFKKIKDSNIILTTYALLRRDLEELQKYEFNAIILDESPEYQKPQYDHRRVPFASWHQSSVSVCPVRPLKTICSNSGRCSNF